MSSTPESNLPEDKAIAVSSGDVLLTAADESAPSVDPGSPELETNDSVTGGTVRPDLGRKKTKVDPLLEQLLQKQRQPWPAGQRPRVEELVKDLPELQASHAALLDLVCAEFCLREVAGECPRLEEYLERFPYLADSLKSRLEARQAKHVVSSRSAPQLDRSPLARELLDQFPFLAPPQQPGDLPMLGSYRIVKVLGKGGMGVVFHAEDPTLDRLVAIKVIRPEVARDAKVKERFLREARAVAKLHDDHIISIYDVKEGNDMSYIVMPLLKGQSLQTRLKENRPLSLAQILRVGREVALGLKAAHRAGQIHRDIKPANLWLDADADGRIKILDWGLARQANNQENLTLDKELLGTPCYMAPEQARSNKEIDARADLFALGAVLYELVTGQRSFERDSIYETLNAVVEKTPQAPVELSPDTPQALSDLVMKLLEKKPADRPANAQAVVAALQDIERQLTSGQNQGAPPTSFGMWKVLCVFLVIIFGSLGAWLAWDHNKNDPSIIASLGAWFAESQDKGEPPVPPPAVPPPDDDKRTEPPKKEAIDPPMKEPIPADRAKASEAVVKKLDQLLKDNKIADARKWIHDNDDVLLPDDRKRVKGELKQKQAVNDHIKEVQGQIADKNYPKALDTIEAAKRDDKIRFAFDEDIKKRDELHSAAKDGIALARFNDAIANAWAALLDGRIKQCQSEIETLESKEFSSNPVGKVHVKLLHAFLVGHQADNEPKKVVAATGLIEALKAEKSHVSELAPKLWRALVKLESAKTPFFYFESLATLKDVPAVVQEDKDLRSELLAAVLRRLVSAESWRPGDTQWNRCSALCNFIRSADEDDWLRALHVECLAEEGVAAAEQKKILFSLDDPTQWYAAYAGALVWEKTDAKKAAKLLVASSALKEKPDVLKPQERSRKAIKILRVAVESLKTGKEKRFTTKEDAETAIPWLELLVALQTTGQQANNQQILDDLLDLTRAASLSKDGAALASAVDRTIKHLGNAKFGAVKKEETYYEFGKAYRDLGSKGEKAFDYLEKALGFSKDKESKWRKLAAQEGADYALTLGTARLDEGKADKKQLDSAMVLSGRAKSFAVELKDFDFERAANLNRDAFALLLDATAAKFPPAESKDGEVAKAFLSALPEKLDVFDLPVVAYKLNYLQKKWYFDKNIDYVKFDKAGKVQKNRLFEKALAEAWLAKTLEKPAKAAIPGDVWWKAMRDELLVGMRNCLVSYADKGYDALEDEPEVDNYNKTHIPRLEPVVKNYQDAKRVSKDMPNLKEEQTVHVIQKLSYTFANLGTAHEDAKEYDAANRHYRSSLEELGELKEFRKKLPTQVQDRWNQFEKRLRGAIERTDKSKQP